MTNPSWSTADLFDEFESEIFVPEVQWLSVGRRNRFAGAVATVELFEDNSQVRTAFAEPGDGRVLVIDGGGSMRRALIGDQLAGSAIENGWVGAVVFGCIRDRAMIDSMEFGIRCLGTNPRKTEKRGQGQRDVPVSFGGCRFSSGMWLYADDDGIVVANRQLVKLP